MTEASQQLQQQGMKRERDSYSSEESELSSLPAAVVIGDDSKLSPAIERLELDHRQENQQQHQQHRHQQRVSFTDHLEVSTSGVTSTMARSATIFRSTATAVAKGRGSGSINSCGRTKPPALSLFADGEEAGGRRVGGNSGGINPLRSPASGGLRSPGTRMLGMGVDGGSVLPSRVRVTCGCWYY